VWAIVRRVNEIFAVFTVRQVGRQAELLIGWHARSASRDLHHGYLT
jgi:hypothetical protein